MQFELREHILNMVFELDKSGHINVQVQVSNMDAEYPTILTFFVDLDQTYLTKWAEDVRKLLEYFPRYEIEHQGTKGLLQATRS